MPTPGRERMAAVALAILAPVVFWGCLETAARLAGVSPLSENKAYVGYTAERQCSSVGARPPRHALPSTSSTATAGCW